MKQFTIHSNEINRSWYHQSSINQYRCASIRCASLHSTDAYSVLSIMLMLIITMWKPKINHTILSNPLIDFSDVNFHQF